MSEKFSKIAEWFKKLGTMIMNNKKRSIIIGAVAAIAISGTITTAVLLGNKDDNDSNGNENTHISGSIDGSGDNSGNNNQGDDNQGDDNQSNNNQGNNNQGNNNQGDNNQGDSLEGKVVITLVGATFSDENSVAILEPNTKVSVTALGIENKTFISWNDEEGNVLELYDDYEFVATENITLTAEYVDNTSSGELAFDTDDGITYYVTGIGTWTGNTLVIPETYNGKPVTKIGIRAFNGNKSIVNLVIPDSITEISSSAFGACTSLKNLTLPNNTATISSDAFNGCTSLTTLYYNLVDASDNSFYSNLKSIRKVVIGDGVLNIPYRAFYSLTNLKCLIIGNGLTYISDDEFEDCSSLINVTIGNSVAKIGAGAFYNCENLESIIFSDSVTKIGENAFWGCDSLTSVYITSISAWCNISFVTDNSNPLYYADNLYLNDELVRDVVIPAGVSSVPANAFSCESIESVTIPSTVTSIGDGAFYGCNKLTSIIIPDSVTEIGYQAFAGCINLTSIRLPFSMEEFNVYSIDNCPALKKIVLPNNCRISGLSPYVEEITLPVSTILPYGSVFTNVKVVNYPGTQTEWPYEISNHFPSNVIINFKADTTYDFDSGLRYTSYGDGTCYVDRIYTVTLSEYVIPEVSPTGDKVVNVAARFNDSIIKSVTIPDSVVSISYEAFSGCSNLTRLVIGNGVKSIGDFAFKGCSNLTSIIIPNSVMSVGNGAFYGCSVLENITLPFVGASATATDYMSHFGYIFGYESDVPNGYSYDTVYYDDGGYLYYIPDSLDNVVITNGITSIKSLAFANCSSIKTITIPDSVTCIGRSAFVRCSNLIQVENGVSYVDRWVVDCYISVETVILRENTIGIADYAFSLCDSLASITIPDGVTSIGNYAFEYCESLASITIPNSVAEIGSFAFEWCDRLTSIRFNGTKAEWEAIDKRFNWHEGSYFVVYCTDGNI